MAITVLPGPGLAALTGQMLGQSVGEGLGSLIEDRFDQLKTRKVLTSLAGSSGALTNQQIKDISKLPKELRQNVLSNFINNLQQMNTMSETNQGTNNIMDNQATPQDVAQQAAAYPTQSQEPGISRELLNAAQPQVNLSNKLNNLTQGIGPQMTIASLLQKPLDFNQQIKMEELKLKKEEIAARKQKNMSESESKLWDKADKYINSIYDKAATAKSNNMDLERFSELESGLDTPAYIEFLKNANMEIPALMSPESQEFLKIRQSFMKDIKTFLGSRISNFELEQFLKTIPDLSQSPEGRKRVIANLKRINNLAIEYSKAIKNTIKNNKGVPPRNLRIKVEKQMKKRMNEVAKQFKEDLNKPSPKFTAIDKITTALGSVLGGAVGAITSPVQKVGSVFMGSLGKGLAGLL